MPTSCRQSKSPWPKAAGSRFPRGLRMRTSPSWTDGGSTRQWWRLAPPPTSVTRARRQASRAPSTRWVRGCWKLRRPVRGARDTSASRRRRVARRADVRARHAGSRQRHGARPSGRQRVPRGCPSQSALRGAQPAWLRRVGAPRLPARVPAAVPWSAGGDPRVSVRDDSRRHQHDLSGRDPYVPEHPPAALARWRHPAVPAVSPRQRYGISQVDLTPAPHAAQDGPFVFASKLYYDTAATGSIGQFKATQEFVDTPQFVFGTDWPWTGELFAPNAPQRWPWFVSYLPRRGDPNPVLSQAFTRPNRLRLERSNALALYPSVAARI